MSMDCDKHGWPDTEKNGPCPDCVEDDKRERLAYLSGLNDAAKIADRFCCGGIGSSVAAVISNEIRAKIKQEGKNGA